MVKLGENIKKYRRAAKMTQEQVGRAIRLNRSSISKIERGETVNVKPEQILELSRLFGCTPTDLIGVSSVQVASSAPLTPDQQKLIAAIPLLTDDQVRVLLDMVRVLASASI